MSSRNSREDSTARKVVNEEEERELAEEFKEAGSCRALWISFGFCPAELGSNCRVLSTSVIG